MTDKEERKIITWAQLESFIDFCPDKKVRKEAWDVLSDAPKHTDEDYQRLLADMNKRYDYVVELEARIKELENTLENHGPEGHNVTNLQFANAVAQWEQEQIEVVSENRQLKVRIKELEDDK
jgi:hypothetical protein